MGAIFYTEPFLTFDLYLFVLLPTTAGGLLSVGTIYDALRTRGYAENKQCVVIEGVPAHFLPAYNPLVKEALVEARETEYEGVSTRVLKAEYLIAICLQTGRPKDRARVAMLRQQASIDRGLLADILKRHHLEEKWTLWMD